MSEEEKESIEIVKKFNRENRYRDCGRVNNAIDRLIVLAEEKEMITKLLKQARTDITLWKEMYENLKKDFDDYKNDKDINYLDRTHHKELVEKSIGQTINNPEECWFDSLEVKIIRNNILYRVNIEKDFITLKEISDEYPNQCITVIAESPLSGAIYRYNNYGKKEWQLIGAMYGYA